VPGDPIHHPRQKYTSNLEWPGARLCDPRHQPKSAFSRFPFVHRANLEGQLWVDSRHLGCLPTCFPCARRRLFLMDEKERNGMGIRAQLIEKLRWQNQRPRHGDARLLGRAACPTAACAFAGVGHTGVRGIRSLGIGGYDGFLGAVRRA
jgi:hypothetical protein